MKPVNSKSLLHFVFDQMEKLDNGTITNETAIAQAKLASQANNILNYELKRAVVELRLKEIGSDIEPHLREIECKNFEV